MTCTNRPEPADRRAAFDQRHEVVRLGALGRAAEVELVGAEHEPLRRDRDPPHAVGLGHVEHDLLVDHQLVVQREVVAVGVERARVERIDHDVAAEPRVDFVAGENHGGAGAGGSVVSLK